MKIPKRLQPILWSKNVDKISPEADRNYIVHQVLMYGDLGDIRWLFDLYSRSKVREVFIKHPKKVYTPPAFRFIKDIVLGLEGQRLEEGKYAKASF